MGTLHKPTRGMGILQESGKFALVKHCTKSLLWILNSEKHFKEGLRDLCSPVHIFVFTPLVAK